MTATLRTGLLLSALALALALAALPSCATTLPYVYAGTGLSRYDSSTGNSAKFRGTTDEQASTTSLGLGLELSENLAVEAGFVDLGSHSWNGRWNGARNSGHVNTDGFAWSVLGKYPLSEQFAVFGRAGMFFWDAEYYENAAGATIYGENHSNSPLLGLGVQATVIEPIDLRLEWTHLNDVWDDPVDLIQLQALYSF